MLYRVLSNHLLGWKPSITPRLFVYRRKYSSSSTSSSTSSSSSSSSSSSTSSTSSSITSSSSPTTFPFDEMEYGTTIKLLRTVLDRRVDQDHNYIPNLSDIETPYTIPTMNIIFQLIERVYTEFTLLDHAYHVARHTKRNVLRMTLRNTIRTTNVYRNFYTNPANINRCLHIWKLLALQQIQYQRSLLLPISISNQSSSSSSDDNNDDHHQKKYYNRHNRSRNIPQKVTVQSMMLMHRNPMARQKVAIANETPIRTLQDVVTWLQYMSQYTMQPNTTPLSHVTFQPDTGTLGILLEVFIEQQLTTTGPFRAPLEVQAFLQTLECTVLNRTTKKNHENETRKDDNHNTTVETITTTGTNYDDNDNNNNKDEKMNDVLTATLPLTEHDTAIVSETTSSSSSSSSSSSLISQPLPPDIYIYSLVMKVWADSNRPETSEKLLSLLEEMRIEHDITPNEVIYGILLRYFAGKNDIHQMKLLYHDMEYVDDVPANLGCYAQIIYGFALSKEHLSEASIVFAKMVISLQKESNTNIRKSTPLIMSSAQNILDGYRRSIESYGSKGSSMTTDEFTAHTNAVLNDAEAFVRKLESSGILVLDGKFGDRIRGTMMDMYARVGTADKLQETIAIFHTMIQPDAIAYTLLLKAYRKNDRADLADEVFQHKLLQDPNVPRVSINLFNSLIYAWADSTLPNAIERGLQVLRLIEKINRVQRYEKRKNQIRTHANPVYLNELNKSRVTFDDFVMNDRNPEVDDKDSNYKRWEQRQNRNKTKKDTKLAEAFIGDSAEQDIIPDTGTYAGLLKCCADAGDGITFPVDMGRKIEGLLLQMENRVVPKSKQHAMTANDIPIHQKIIKLTAAHYVTAIRACLRVQELDTAESILRRMDIHCINPPPDITIYNSILDQYAQFCTKQAVLIEKLTADDKERTELILFNVKAAHRATRILHFIINSVDDIQSPGSYRPNHVSYNRVLQCWSKSYDPNAVQHMWELYQESCRQYRFESSKFDVHGDVKPQRAPCVHSVCYDTMIKFYTDISTQYSIQKALLLLETLESSDTLDLKPHPWHYTALVKSLINLKDVDTAASVLLRAIERHFGNDSSQRRSPMNTIPTMLHSLIMSWIESNQLEKASQYIDNYFILQNSCKHTDPIANQTFNVLPTLLALQTAWKGRETQHPDNHHHINKLDRHINAVQLTIESPPSTTVDLAVPMRMEPLPPPPEYNYEITPTNC